MRARGLVAACLVLATAALFFTAPMDGDFWWSDAPRHAMDGLFMRDLLLAHPFHHPAAWAIGYYVRHPALTILFYPPLFPTVEAGFFLVFGASHACTQVTVACFILLLGTAAYGLARMMLPRLAALGCALLVIGAPEAAFWGRQVMLDVPAYALGTAAAYCLAQYLREGRPGFFYAIGHGQQRPDCQRSRASLAVLRGPTSGPAWLGAAVHRGCRPFPPGARSHS
jgi:hypothetical protein